MRSWTRTEYAILVQPRDHTVEAAPAAATHPVPIAEAPSDAETPAEGFRPVEVDWLLGQPMTSKCRRYVMVSPGLIVKVLGDTSTVPPHAGLWAPWRDETAARRGWRGALTSRDDDGEDDKTWPAEAETPQPGGRRQHGPANGFRHRRHREDAGVRGEERSRMHPFRLESQLLYHQSPYIWCMRRVGVCIPCYTYSIGDGYCDLYPRHSGHTSAGRSGPPRAAPLMCSPSQTANDCTTLWHHQNPAQPPPLQGAGEDSTIHATHKTS